VYDIILVIHTLLVLFLIGMVLVQRSDSDGLSGLGGGGGNQFMTGRGAANMMTRTTAILAGCFMVTSLVLATMIGRSDQGSIIDKIDAVPAAVDAAVPAEKQPATQEPVAPKPE
jgi:preprotein translocase subunit SecG